MRLDQHKGFALAGDLGASLGALVMAISHWAAILNPIVTLLVGMAALIWWGLRYRDRMAGKGAGE